jgi:hypothetical protein
MVDVSFVSGVFKISYISEAVTASVLKCKCTYVLLKGYVIVRGDHVGIRGPKMRKVLN